MYQKILQESSRKKTEETTFVQEDVATGISSQKKLKCDKCKYSTKKIALLKKHINEKHKDVPPTLSSPTPIPTSCAQSDEGCPNVVNIYTDPQTALCPSCELFIQEQFCAFQPPPNLCLCCRDHP